MIKLIINEIKNKTNHFRMRGYDVEMLHSEEEGEEDAGVVVRILKTKYSFQCCDVQDSEDDHDDDDDDEDSCAPPSGCALISCAMH